MRRPRKRKARAWARQGEFLPSMHPHPPCAALLPPPSFAPPLAEAHSKHSRTLLHRPCTKLVLGGLSWETNEGELCPPFFCTHLRGAAGDWLGGLNNAPPAPTPYTDKLKAHFDEYGEILEVVSSGGRLLVLRPPSSAPPPC